MLAVEPNVPSQLKKKGVILFEDDISPQRKLQLCAKYSWTKDECQFNRKRIMRLLKRKSDLNTDFQLHPMVLDLEKKLVDQFEEWEIDEKRVVSFSTIIFDAPEIEGLNANQNHDDLMFCALQDQVFHWGYREVMKKYFFLSLFSSLRYFSNFYVEIIK